MYARMVKFVLGPDTQWEADRMADVVLMWLEEEPGFRGLECLGDYDNGEYHWISYWTTLAAAERAQQNIYPKFKTLIGDKFQWTPSIQLFRQYVPRQRRFEE